ncbi:MAG: hypothetical protein ACRDJ4_03175 [Actinomycetota bacterium]
MPLTMTRCGLGARRRVRRNPSNEAGFLGDERPGGPDVVRFGPERADPDHDGLGAGAQQGHHEAVRLRMEADLGGGCGRVEGDDPVER